MSKGSAIAFGSRAFDYDDVLLATDDLLQFPRSQGSHW